jgi:hypothetical protein
MTVRPSVCACSHDSSPFVRTKAEVSSLCVGDIRFGAGNENQSSPRPSPLVLPLCLGRSLTGSRALNEAGGE